MENSNKNIMPDFHLFPRLERAGRFIAGLLTRHQLANHGDNFVHPLDDTFDAPAYQQQTLEYPESEA